MVKIWYIQHNNINLGLLVIFTKHIKMYECRIFSQIEY